MDNLWNLIFSVGGAFLIIIALTLYSKNRSKYRNEEGAIYRINKKLLRIVKDKAVVLSKTTLEYNGKKLYYHFIIIDRAGIIAAKVFGCGQKVTGNEDDAHWKLEDRKEAVLIQNPLKEIYSGYKLLEMISTQEERKNASVYPVVIFANPYDDTTFSGLPNDKVISYKQIGTWFKNRNNLPDSTIPMEILVERIKKAIVNQ